MSTEQTPLLLQQLLQTQTLPQKRVWIKRDTTGPVGSTPTTVQVTNQDIVDDLKSLILAKYPNTLAREVDPADLIISRHNIVLLPDENVFSILDRFFPSGNPMTVNDAFLVSVRPQQQLNVLQQTQQQSGTESPRPASVNEEKKTQQPPQPQLQPEIDFQIPGASESATTSPVLLPNESLKKSDSNKGTKRTRANSTKSKTSGNGVILLPRQFKNNSTVGTPGVGSGNSNSGGSYGNRKGMSKFSIEVGRYPSREIHHTKSGAYQRVNRPSPMTSLTPTLAPAGTFLPSSPNLASPSPALQDEQNHQEDVEQGRRTRAVSNPGVRPKLATMRQSSQQLVSRVSRTNSTGRESPHPTPSNATMNNKKLLLSINKGISPYTTVVPQVNVLIVEDNVINQKILETYLRKRKIRSSTAKNGKEAIEKWKQGGFHLVLMDIQLPVMNGIEATKKIRQLENLNRIGVFSSVNNASVAVDPAVKLAEDEILDTKRFRSPVIIVALTASSSLAAKSEALAAGCNDFLTKPVNLKWLEQKTIEWGCMQALIDFEGWKMWVSK